MPGDDAAPLPTLEHVRWTARPDVRRPVLITAFEGWNDAGDAASTAGQFLAEAWDATPFATIDPEVFYDFTSTRPEVRFGETGQREIVWPENELLAVTVRPGVDVILLLGVEPQLRWRTFCAQVTGLAQWFEAPLVVSLGALLAEVPHSRPTPVYGTAYDDEVTEALGLMPSRYEGPTGIVGVLHAACQDAGLRSASLWGAVPSYVPTVPSPKAALALVERTARLLEVSVAADELSEAAADYEQQIDEVVEADQESRDFVSHLEQQYDADETLAFGDTDVLMAEVEQFLRDQRD